MFKKINSFLILSLLLNLLPVSTFAQSNNFWDLAEDSPKFDAIKFLQSEGVVQGYEDGSFKERNRISRAEFTKIIIASQFSEQEIEACDTTSLMFPDISVDEWYAPFLCVAVSQKIISGYPDGTFRPADRINFAEASKILSESFNLNISVESTEWYTGYVASLEENAAIPSSVDSLDVDLTRGDMAEIVYRLDTQNTSKPTQTLANLTSEIGKITSCDALVERVADRNYYPMLYRFDLDFATTPAPTSSSPEAGFVSDMGGGAGEKDFSFTNIQEQGIDEPDVVKTNGDFIYTINSNFENPAVQITQNNQGRLELKSSVLFSNQTPQGIFINKNQLIVLTTSNYGWIRPFAADTKEEIVVQSNNQPIESSNYYDYYVEDYTEGEMLIEEDFRISEDAIAIFPPVSYEQKTGVLIFDVSNPVTPVLQKQVEIDGYYNNARLMGDDLFFISSHYPNTWGMKKQDLQGENLIPKISIDKKQSQPVVDCTDITYLPNHSNSNFTVVTTLSTSNLQAPISHEVIIAPVDNLYMSAQNIYLTQPKFNYWYFSDFEAGESDQSTNIFKFNIKNAKPSFQGMMSVPGLVNNQFAMSEHKNHFRVATTLDPWNSRNDKSENNLYVFDDNLNRVGVIEGLAAGERIYSTRFIGDRAYMVTFEQIDPLFVFDLSNPSQPKVLGELKIPGFSNYLHPYDENHLIGFGQDASMDGQIQGFKLSLFNVENPTDPKEVHTFKIGDRGTYSELEYNHKALLFSKDKNIIAFPISIYENKQPGIDTWGDLTFMGAVNLGLDLQNGFSLKAKYTHLAEGIDSEFPWNYDYNSVINRLIYVDDNIFTISNAEIQSHNLDNNDIIDSVQLIKTM